MKTIKWIAFCTICVGVGFYLSQRVQAQNERLPPIQIGVEGKKKGEVVALVSDQQIVAYCDFEKAIVLTNQHVLCVYMGSGEENAPVNAPT